MCKTTQNTQTKNSDIDHLKIVIKSLESTIKYLLNLIIINSYSNYD